MGTAKGRQILRHSVSVRKALRWLHLGHAQALAWCHSVSEALEAAGPSPEVLERRKAGSAAVSRTPQERRGAKHTRLGSREMLARARAGAWAARVGTSCDTSVPTARPATRAALAPGRLPRSVTTL